MGRHECLIVTRFDRRVGPDGTVTRVHQEDLCQALNVDHEAHRGRGKYQHAGGPSFQQCARLLDAYAKQPLEQLDRLTCVATFTVLIGNADAHGKNVALVHREPEHVELAPLYDTVPTMYWPDDLKTRAAMFIGGRTDLSEVTRMDLLDETARWGYPRERAARAVDRTIEAVCDALDRDLVPDAALVALIRGQAAKLAG